MMISLGHQLLIWLLAYKWHWTTKSRIDKTTSATSVFTEKNTHKRKSLRMNVVSYGGSNVSKKWHQGLGLIPGIFPDFHFLQCAHIATGLFRYFWQEPL